MYKNRTYRNLVHRNDLVSFNVTVSETDLFVSAVKPFEDLTKELILRYRAYIEAYIQTYPEFAKTLKPWHIKGPSPTIIKDMAIAGKNAGVGTMAAVAGAIAENVGLNLLSHTDEVIVENGGDVFLKTNDQVTIGIFAGTSPLNLRIGLRIDSRTKPVSVCTSSGTVGHSLSYGTADAVVALSRSAVLADAAATAIGNRVRQPDDVTGAIEFAQSIPGLKGLIIIKDDTIGLWGEIKLCQTSN